MTVSYDYTRVQYKDGQVRIVRHQKGASDVRHVPVTDELNAHYLALMERFHAEPND